MLKLNYTDSGLFLELITASLETVATQRVMLAVYAGEALYLEPGRASFLLSATDPGLGALQSTLRQSNPLQSPTLQDHQEMNSPPVTIAAVDGEFVEVSLKGTWMANSAVAEEGTFIALLSPEQEVLIYGLWQATQPPIANLCGVHSIAN